MKTALFTNFSKEPFTGYWNGKGKTFQPGQSVYMPDYLAKHFAKHLTNRELLKRGFERDTSPKAKIDKATGKEYIDNENFNKFFNQAFQPDEDEELGEERDNIDVQIAVANKNRQKKAEEAESEEKPEPRVKKDEVQDPTQPQIIIPPDFDDEDEDEEETPADKGLGLAT